MDKYLACFNKIQKPKGLYRLSRHDLITHIYCEANKNCTLVGQLGIRYTYWIPYLLQFTISITFGHSSRCTRSCFSMYDMLMDDCMASSLHHLQKLETQVNLLLYNLFFLFLLRGIYRYLQYMIRHIEIWGSNIEIQA